MKTSSNVIHCAFGRASNPMPPLQRLIHDHSWGRSVVSGVKAMEVYCWRERERLTQADIDGAFTMLFMPFAVELFDDISRDVHLNRGAARELVAAMITQRPELIRPSHIFKVIDGLDYNYPFGVQAYDMMGLLNRMASKQDLNFTDEVMDRLDRFVGNNPDLENKIGNITGTLETRHLVDALKNNWSWNYRQI